MKLVNRVPSATYTVSPEGGAVTIAEVDATLVDSGALYVNVSALTGTPNDFSIFTLTPIEVVSGNLASVSDADGVSFNFDLSGPATFSGTGLLPGVKYALSVTFNDGLETVTASFSVVTQIAN